MTEHTRRINGPASHHHYLLDNTRVDPVTFAQDGVPKPALIAWAARVTAEYVADHLDDADQYGDPTDRLLEALRDAVSHDARSRWPPGPPDPKRVADALAGVHRRDRDRAKGRGLEVHRLVERHQHDTPPTDLAGHIAAYRQYRADWQPTHEMAEVVVGNRTHQYMGTVDILAHLAPLGTCLIDVKTARAGIHAQDALQLAAYRTAEFYLDPTTGTEEPMPAIDHTLALWLHPDGYQLHPVPTGEHQFGVWLAARRVARFMRHDAKHAVHPALTPPRTATPSATPQGY